MPNHNGRGDTRWCLPALRHILIVALLLSVLSATASAQTAGRAGLLVLHSDGRLISRCIEFPEAEISGYDLLLRSGLDLNAENSSMGMAICRIDQVGCTTPQEPCFCSMTDGRQMYWSYWQRREAGWVYSQLGASNSRVRPGMVDAWIWGSGESSAANALQGIGFDQVCAPPATDTPSPSPTETPPPTNTPTATPSSTPSPTASTTPFPSATPTPTWTPWPTPTVTPPASPTSIAEQDWSPPPTETGSPTHTASPMTTPTMPQPTVTASQEPATPTTTPTPLVLLPLIDTFYADPPTILAGETTQLVWSTRRVHHVTLQAMDLTGEVRQGRVDATGSLTIAPRQTTRYRLVAWQNDLYTESVIEVTVLLPSATSTPPPTHETTPTLDITPTALNLPAPAPPNVSTSTTPETTAPRVETVLLLLAIGALFLLGISLLGLLAIVALTWLLTDLR